MRRLDWYRASIAGMVVLFGGGGAVALPAQDTALSAADPGSRAAFAPAREAAPTAKSARLAAETYIIGPGDVLAIHVWKEPELSRTLPVRPDGRISLPVIGETEAAGLTAPQLQLQLSDRLRDYVRNPQINVIVQEIKSRSFNVVGRVAKPGAFPLSRPTTVLDALALAGGFRDYAHTTKIYVLRREAHGAERMLPFNYKQVIKGQHPEQNRELESGDTVVIP